MKRYVVRALVAVLTFCIGVAVGLGPRRPRYGYRYHHEECRKFRLKLDSSRLGNDYFSYRGPSVSIDTMQADPLKLIYSSTNSSQASPSRQRIEFLVELNSQRAISSYTVHYESTRRNERSSTDISQIRNTGTQSGVETVSLECDAGDTIMVWVSTIQFRDGTQWENPRHRVGQSNL